MSQAHRLITNTLLMQSRMVLTVGMGILTTSLLLRQLNGINYGLWMAVSAFVSLVVFPLDALRMSCQRHISYAVGLNDPAVLQRAYSSMLWVFCLLGLLIAVTGLPLSFAVSYLLEVPEERHLAAIVTFALVILTTAANTAATPVMTLIVGHQDLQIVAAYEVMTSVVRLLIAITLPYLPGDSLIVLVSLITAWSGVCQLLMLLTTRKVYAQIRATFRERTRSDAKALLGFAGWSSVETGAWRGILNGGAILLNRFFGPEVNAGYAVALQAAGYINSLNATFRRVTEPATVASYAAGATRNFERLVLATSKYGFTLGCGLALVLILWAPEVLALWLGDVPPAAAILTRWVVAGVLLDMATKGHELGLIADGRIRAMSLASAGFLAVVLGAAVAAATLGGVGPELAGMAVFAMHLMVSLYRVFIVGRRLAVPVVRWARAVLLPCAAVTVATGTAVWFSSPMAERYPWTIVPAIAVFTLLAAALGWGIVLTSEERGSFISLFRKLVGNASKLRRARDEEQAGSSSR